MNSKNVSGRISYVDMPKMKLSDVMWVVQCMPLDIGFEHEVWIDVADVIGRLHSPEVHTYKLEKMTVAQFNNISWAFASRLHENCFSSKKAAEKFANECNLRDLMVLQRYYQAIQKRLESASQKVAKRCQQLGAKSK